ncbi:MAG TPA: AAA family ATPase [Actinomycetota bacterium]|nr:AAA family ATPase [Actinomycetota bacterium]
MYVRSLRLAGFKSFATPTVLDFEEGVNVIVGPNGSGKSNIADALAWVLGSQAPTSLRGASMEDVIFAGSQSKPRLGSAEVSLTLDNTSRTLPLDLTEVTISRSTDRSGASEYRINGAPCRLMDIAELLSDTGIGRSIHTVVSQGNLDAVLEARPEERRAFIEEAAHIGKHRRRKDRALRKIERVDDNLTRLNDVLEELRRSIRPLKRQASVAAQYSELLSEHRDLRQRLTATELHRLKVEDDAADVEAAVHRATLLAEELATVRARLATSEREREELASAAERASDVSHSMGRAHDRLRSLARLAGERSERLQARLSAETEQGYQERIRLLTDAKKRWGTEVGALTLVADDVRTRAEGGRAERRAAEAKVASADDALSSARNAETGAAQALVRSEGSEAAGRATLGAIDARVKAVEERRDVTQRELTADAERVAAAEAEVRALESELDVAAGTAAEAESVLEGSREHADELRRALNTSEAGRSAAAARSDALEEVDHLLDGLDEAKARIAPLLLSARAAGDVAKAGRDEAARLVAEADALVEQRWQDVARHDQELRRLDALMSGAAERLTGARRQRETREIELAALDEELARANDALAAAERDATEERAQIPMHRARLEETQRTRAACESALEEAKAEAAAIAQRSSAAELDARAAEERVLAARLRLEEAEAGLADAEKALAGLADLRAQLSEAVERAAAVADAALTAAGVAARWGEEAADRATAARTEAHAADARFTSMRARETELSRHLEDVAKARNIAEVRRAETRARSEAVAERAMDEWGLGLDALMALEPYPVEEEPAARTRAERLERDMKRLGTVNPHAAEEFVELSEREAFLVTQMEDLRTSRRDLMKVVREVDETIEMVFNQAFEDVARQFEGVIARLFPGGSGRLKLTDPNDMLTTGIEIEARPPGKNVRKLSLLSGGERSLVALAFLFSIFRSRPSPFYLLDEVEAALDDVNLSRFLGLIHELEEHAQVLIVTHQKRTMEAADVLYGVSMAKDGISHVIAKRLSEVPI